jgi:dTDP-4-amino-4,6-dideoxygalactose transaminase
MPLETIPVLRPLLPPADRLLPYLRLIDASRTYTNWGPLVCQFERRVAGCFGLAEDGVVSASSGTAALIGAILATAGRATASRPFAVVPAFTFVATAVAVEQCGYYPYVVDVDPDTWMMDPERLASHAILDRTGLVVPVAAFGRSVGQNPWLAFREQTGIAVVVDGAASFETASAAPRLMIGDIPVSFSFHATKTFSTGEGGGVATTNAQLAQRVTEALNFGFFADRESRVASINGKMSEYHAAVGLAELDGWPAKSDAFRTVADRYLKRLTAMGLGERVVLTPSVAACYALFQCANINEATRVQEGLARCGIEFRFWYGKGLHKQPRFQNVSRDNLHVVDDLAPLIIGLPVAIDFTDHDVDRVVEALGKAVRRDN